MDRKHSALFKHEPFQQSVIEEDEGEKKENRMPVFDNV